MILSREMAICVKFLPFSVAIGCIDSAEKSAPHCRRSPSSVIAAPKLRSSLISRRRIPSKNDILLGDLIKASSESGAATRPLFDPQAYTPGFSQLFLTCTCCELMDSRFSSFVCPFFFLVFSIAVSTGASGVSACSSLIPNRPEL